MFNVGQREKRRSMVQLYGVKKQLLNHGAVMDSKEFFPILLFQVSTLAVFDLLTDAIAVFCMSTYGHAAARKACNLRLR